MSFLRQLWHCTRCAEVRVWGNTVAANPNYLPYLYCNKCKRHTQHRFDRHEIEEPLELGMRKLS